MIISYYRKGRSSSLNSDLVKLVNYDRDSRLWYFYQMKIKAIWSPTLWLIPSNGMCGCHSAASLGYYPWPIYKLEQNKWTWQLCRGSPCMGMILSLGFYIGAVLNLLTCHIHTVDPPGCLREKPHVKSASSSWYPTWGILDTAKLADWKC